MNAYCCCVQLRWCRRSQADLILGIGSRFDDRTTGVVAKYAPAALAAERAGVGGIVHVDIEESQIGCLLLTRVPCKLLNIALLAGEI